MGSDALFDFLVKGATRPVSGWNFSYVAVTQRLVTEPLPWSYASNVLPRLQCVESLLDMGTGGGEFLSLLHPFPKHTYATEGYAPNVPIARQRLEPLGVKVIQSRDDNHLPFADDEFELVINRHECYKPSEVARVLTSHGQFITQQVGEQNNLELNQMLGAKTGSNNKFWNVVTAVEELKTAGFVILEQQEAFPVTRFYDIGAVVYYLNAVSWQIPGFSVESFAPALRRIHQQIQQQGYLEVPSHRFLIIAYKE
ncbi:MAG: class I SAM-dependent methyltransferase [Promethearchaeota archaeon]